MRISAFCSVFSVFLVGLTSAFPELPASCPQILPAPAAAALPSYFLPKPIKDSQLDDIETIRQTLHFYALVLDSKTFPLLDRVFAPTATANYSGLAGIFEGLPAIQTFLSGSLVAYPKTQHLIGNHIIDVCAPKSAVSQTYFQATHFPNTTAGVFTAYVTHQDVWEKTKDGWRIVYSNFEITVSFLARKNEVLGKHANINAGQTMSMLFEEPVSLEIPVDCSMHVSRVVLRSVILGNLHFKSIRLASLHIPHDISTFFLPIQIHLHALHVCTPNLNLEVCTSKLPFHLDATPALW